MLANNNESTCHKNIKLSKLSKIHRMRFYKTVYQRYTQGITPRFVVYIYFELTLKGFLVNAHSVINEPRNVVIPKCLIS